MKLSRTEQLSWTHSCRCWRWSNPADLAATWGCNALLELLSMHERPWTKRRRSKHTGPLDVTVGWLNLRRHLDETQTHWSNSHDRRLISHNASMFYLFLILCPKTGRDTRCLGWTVGRTGQIRLLCWKVCCLQCPLSKQSSFFLLVQLLFYSFSHEIQCKRYRALKKISLNLCSALM